MRLLLDEMYTPAIAEGLRDRGHDVISVHERPDLVAAPDSAIFAAAQAEERAIVTNNVRDFMPLAHEALQTRSIFYGLVLTSDRSLPREQAHDRNVHPSARRAPEPASHGRRARRPDSLAQQWLAWDADEVSLGLSAGQSRSHGRSSSRAPWRDGRASQASFRTVRSRSGRWRCCWCPSARLPAAGRGPAPGVARSRAERLLHTVRVEPAHPGIPCWHALGEHSLSRRCCRSDSHSALRPDPSEYPRPVSWR